MPAHRRKKSKLHALEEDPEDAATWLVYSDYLSSIGDPRGDLAALWRTDAAEAEALLHAFGDELLGLGTAPGYKIGWHHGHARSLVVEEPFGSLPEPREVLLDLLARPIARFLREIQVSWFSFPAVRPQSKARDYNRTRLAGIVEALAAQPRPALRTLIFGARGFADETAVDEEGRDALQYLGDFGKLEALWPALPRLEQLVISGGWVRLGVPPALPMLRDFELRQSSLSVEQLDALLDADLPKLERLSLWCGAHDQHEDWAVYDYRPAQLVALAGRFPGLRSVGFVSTMETEAIASQLLSASLPFTELDLGGGVLDDAGLETLVQRHRPRLAKLASLDLRHNLLTPAHAAAVTAGLPGVLIEPQRNARSFLQPRFNACQE